MTWKNLASAILLCVIPSAIYAQPTMSVTPGGLQSGNWVWDVSVTPDLILAETSTPMAVELGFQLTNSPLLSVTNVNPSEWDTSNPGKIIFGWETTYPESLNRPEGIEVNCTGCTITNNTSGTGHAAAVVTGTTNEIFAALGSVDFATPGAKSMLQIIARGPGNGGSSTSSIQWLGAYAVGQGRIAQLVNGPFGFTAVNFDLFSGSATQSNIPEPAGGILVAVGAIAMGLQRRKR